MISRRDTLKVLLGGTFAATNLGLINSALAERVYNHAERKWVEVDLSQIRTDRRVPSKYKRKNVRINTSHPVGTIIIHTDKKFLYHI